MPITGSTMLVATHAEAEARDFGVGEPVHVGALLADGPGQPDPGGEDQLTAGQPRGDL
jgi:hypothetical protein